MSSFPVIRSLPIVLGTALLLSACAPSTLPPPEGSPNSASPTTGGPLSGTPEPELARHKSATPNDGTRYECNTGQTITAAYPDIRTARVTVDGRTLEMHIAVSADGARYVGQDYEWWTRGSGPRTEASLYAHNADNSTGRQVAQCTPAG